jgi:hypothetical protein
VIGVTNAPLTATVSPNTFNQNFEISILLNVVESYILGAYKVCIENYFRNFKKGSFDWEFKLPFLIVESE